MLTEKVIVIAGSNGRLGRSFSEAVLDSNGTCIMADIETTAGQNMTMGLSANQNNKKIDFVQLDVTSKESLTSLIEKVSKKYGKIDAFVNTTYPRNSNWGKRFEEVDYNDFCENASLHLGGYFNSAQQFCIFFKQQGYGNIIQVSSIMGAFAPKFDVYEGIEVNGKEMTSPAEYSIFKAGIIHFSRYLAQYYKNYNIRSNCISPGGILDAQPEEFLERYRRYCASKGMLEANDLNGILIFLLSDWSRFMTGQNIVIDDGWSL